MKPILSFFFALIAGTLIFVGLPMLGWGLGDLPHFYEQSARMAYVVVIFALQIFSLIYNPQAGKNNRTSKDGAKVDLILIQILSLAVVILAPFSDARGILPLGSAAIIRYLGVVIIVPGFILMQMAEKYLDKQFSIEVTLQKEHQLIQSGPYKYIRHPRYLGILIFFKGISLAFNSILGLMIVLALLVVLVWRIRAEDDLMRREFGAAWETYRKKSWRIIPFIF